MPRRLSPAAEILCFQLRDPIFRRAQLVADAIAPLNASRIKKRAEAAPDFLYGKHVGNSTG
jgi:hypothetical protein